MVELRRVCCRRPACHLHLELEALTREPVHCSNASAAHSRRIGVAAASEPRLQAALTLQRVHQRHRLEDGTLAGFCSHSPATRDTSAAMTMMMAKDAAETVAATMRMMTTTAAATTTTTTIANDGHQPAAACTQASRHESHVNAIKSYSQIISRR